MHREWTCEGDYYNLYKGVMSPETTLKNSIT